MRLKRKAFAALILASTFTLFGCGKTEVPTTTVTTTTTESDRIEEDLTKPTILDDNYRNFYEIYCYNSRPCNRSTRTST